jgi:DNA-directed RNA polymerase specialized sigma24 family protein
MKPGNDLTLCTDEVLLRHIMQGNKDALVTVFDRYAADLYRHILPLIRSYELNDHAEDDTKFILIAIFVTLWDDRETLSISTTLSHYLFSEAHDRAIQFVHCENPPALMQVSGQ